jgi:uncharacterized protein YdaU (DUF1376 family)
MNFYPHHIGDFNNASRHLSRTERSIYRDLMDLYYDTEGPLSLDVDRVCRLVIAQDDEEKQAVMQVLSEFFVQTESGWLNTRCEEEIAKYKSIVDAKSAAGKASAAARSGKKQHGSNGRSTGVQQPLNGCGTNQEPLTKNQIDQHNTLSAGSENSADPKSPSEMTLEWQPDTKLLATYAKRMGLPVSLFTHEAIGAFVCHYSASGRFETQAAWVSLLVKWIKRDSATGAAANNVHKFPVRASSEPDFDDTSWADGLVVKT